MKRFLALAAAVVISCAVMSFAGEATPVKISLIPMLSVPSQKTVHGLDLGIISTKVEEVQGLQLSWIYASTSKKMVGVQSSFVSIAGGDFTGVQTGFYNSTKNMTGLQYGFINVADTLDGVQLGLVNIIHKGAPLHFMVIVNANFK